jgi:hypothetical protein
MPLVSLFCDSLPKVMPQKKNFRIKQKMEPTEVTIFFEMKHSKSDIPVQNDEEKKWRDNVWKKILSLQNIDNKIPIDNNDGFLNKILVEDFHADVKDLKGALASAVCVKALTVNMEIPSVLQE